MNRDAKADGASKKAVPKADVQQRQRQAAAVHERLHRAIPTPRIELDYAGPWQLLVAVILSAQCTDKIVNRVTPVLFRRYPTPRALAAASQQEVEEIIRPTGFYHNKAKAICQASEALVERYGGQVPKQIDELVQIPGVARKTANVVLGTAYGIASGIVVDTHVGRVARRLGLSRQEDPVRVEAELGAIIPRPQWIEAGLRLQLHGRYVCTAKAPRCKDCPLNEICPSREAKAPSRFLDRVALERRLVESPPGDRGDQDRGDRDQAA